MPESYVMGIDGGGSTVRVAILTPALDVVAETSGPAVNPGTVGRDESARRIQAAMRAALQQAGLRPEQLGGVGVGVAGASNRYEWAAPWLRDVVRGVAGQARVVPSSDYEIALVGAHGQRLGILLLAGTGSLAYGVNPAGESALVGGWGYRLGDEGSGYWLGAQGLQAALRMADGRGRHTLLHDALLNALGLAQPLDLIGWLYGDPRRVAEVARLAVPVLECAAGGDSVAQAIVEQGARELVLAVRTVRHWLKLHDQTPAFAGSLLAEPNPLRQRVCALLNLDSVPPPRYPPVIGAALLAL